MKKLSLYIFLGLLWCNVGFAKDLGGTELFCKQEGDNYREATGYSFRNEITVYEYYFSDWMLTIAMKAYTVKPDIIRIGSLKITPDNFSMEPPFIEINRKTLRKSNGQLCEIFNDDVDIEVFMQRILDREIKAQESENKL